MPLPKQAKHFQVYCSASCNVSRTDSVIDASVSCRWEKTKQL
jgi:hypothetical protein